MKLADYSQTVTGPELDAALRSGGFDGVFHYLRGTPGWVLHVDTLAVVADIRSRGWWQLGIDLPFNPSDADGAALVAVARAYGFPPGSLMALDVEPARFALDPTGWARAAAAWCDGVRAGGYSPGPYGTDETVAACGSRADWIWRAKPGQCDPAGPGLADAFFAGHRVVQCASGVWGGVEFDVSFSQIIPQGGAEVLDPVNDPTVVLILKQLSDLHTGWDTQQGELQALLAGQAAAKTELDTLEAAVAALQAAGVPPATLQPVLDSIAQLKVHLGVGNP